MTSPGPASHPEPSHDAASADRPLAVVTGATGGLGIEFVRQLAGAGHRILASARSAERLARLGDDLGGAAYDFHAADLGRARDVLALAERLRDEPVAVLVNNAGFGSYGHFAELDVERELEQARVNMLAPMELSHAVLPGMIERHRGEIINVASIAGSQPVPRMATYSASKAFVRTFSHALAEELRGTGVTVTCLNPGPVETGFFEAAGSSDFRSGQTVPAATVVARALAAATKGRSAVTPGAGNLALGTLSEVTPQGLSARIAGWVVRPKS